MKTQSEEKKEMEDEKGNLLASSPLFSFLFFSLVLDIPSRPSKIGL